MKSLDGTAVSNGVSSFTIKRDTFYYGSIQGTNLFDGMSVVMNRCASSTTTCCAIPATTTADGVNRVRVLSLASSADGSETHFELRPMTTNPAGTYALCYYTGSRFLHATDSVSGTRIFASLLDSQTVVTPTLVSIGNVTSYKVPFSFAGAVPIQIRVPLAYTAQQIREQGWQLKAISSSLGCSVVTKANLPLYVDPPPQSQSNDIVCTASSICTLYLRVEQRHSLSVATNQAVCFSASNGASFAATDITFSIAMLHAVNGVEVLKATAGTVLFASILGTNLEHDMYVVVAEDCSSNADTLKQQAIALGTSDVIQLPVPESSAGTFNPKGDGDDDDDDTTIAYVCLSADHGSTFVPQTPTVVILPPSITMFEDSGVGANELRAGGDRRDSVRSHTVLLLGRGLASGMVLVVGCAMSASTYEYSSPITCEGERCSFTTIDIPDLRAAPVRLPICVQHYSALYKTGLKFVILPWSATAYEQGTLTKVVSSVTFAGGASAIADAGEDVATPVESTLVLQLNCTIPCIGQAARLIDVGASCGNNTDVAPSVIDSSQMLHLAAPNVGNQCHHAQLCLQVAPSVWLSQELVRLCVAARALLALDDDTVIEFNRNEQRVLKVSSQGLPMLSYIGLFPPAAGCNASFMLRGLRVPVVSGYVDIPKQLTSNTTDVPQIVCFSVDGVTYSPSNVTISVVSTATEDDWTPFTALSQAKTITVLRGSGGTVDVSRWIGAVTDRSLVMLSEDCRFNTHGIPVMTASNGRISLLATHTSRASSIVGWRVCLRRASLISNIFSGVTLTFATALFVDTGVRFRVLNVSTAAAAVSSITAIPSSTSAQTIIDRQPAYRLGQDNSSAVDAAPQWQRIGMRGDYPVIIPLSFAGAVNSKAMAAVDDPDINVLSLAMYASLGLLRLRLGRPCDSNNSAFEQSLNFMTVKLTGASGAFSSVSALRFAVTTEQLLAFPEGEWWSLCASLDGGALYTSTGISIAFVSPQRTQTQLFFDTTTLGRAASRWAWTEGTEAVSSIMHFYWGAPLTAPLSVVPKIPVPTAMDSTLLELLWRGFASDSLGAGGVFMHLQNAMPRKQRLASTPLPRHAQLPPPSH